MLRAAKSAARRCAASAWRATHRDFLLIFNYHRISPNLPEGEASAGTWTSTAAFEAELEALASEFQVVPLQHAIPALKKGSLRGRCCAITIDDGDESVARYAVPILTKLGLPASFFVNTAYFAGDGHYCFTILDAFLARGIETDTAANDRATLRNTNDPEVYRRIRDRVEASSQRARLRPRKCVTPEWLTALDAKQFTIGAHGHEHQRFSMMGVDWQRQDLKKNIEILRNFDAFQPWFAIPFGRSHDFDHITERTAAELGLTVLGAEGGINLQDRGCVRRIPADGAIVKKLLLREMAGW